MQSLSNSYCYPYPRPAVTVDAAIFSGSSGHYRVLLIRRKHPPFESYWAFPGGFVDEHETLEQAVERETYEEAGLSGLDFGQFRAYSEPSRDPRQRTITLVFVAFVNHELLPDAGDDADSAAWFSINDLPPMAFDHAKILNDIMNRYQMAR